MLSEISGAFAVDGELEALVPYGSGHIHDTFLGSYRSGQVTTRYIHQRINRKVFPDPEKVMTNIAQVTSYLRRRLIEMNCIDVERRVVSLIPSRQGTTHFIDGAGDYWRTYRFIEGTLSRETAATPNDALEAAKCFGTFQRLLMDYDGEPLHTTLPGFHDTERRLEQLEAAAAADPLGRAREADVELEFVARHRELASGLQNHVRSGAMQERITHNDAKLGNVLLDAKTGEGLCVVDLDTVMLGLPLYDFGDLVRSAAGTTREDERDLSRVKVDVSMFRALAQGYAYGLGARLSPCERQNMVLAGKVITLTMGLRFLTDYLLGDTYYKIARVTHNLERARVQFALIKSLEAQEPELMSYLQVLG